MMTVRQAREGGFEYPPGFIGLVFRIRKECLRLEDDLYRHYHWILAGEQRNDKYAKFFKTRYGNITEAIKIRSIVLGSYVDHILSDQSLPGVMKDYALVLRRHAAEMIERVDELWLYIERAKVIMGW